MNNEKKYYIVEESVLPEVIIKVLKAKHLLDSGKVKTVQSAAEIVGVSRSAIYKYRESIFPFYEKIHGRTITIAMNLDDTPGLLSLILNIIAQSGANILTINQTIPINNIANVTISIETGSQDIGILIKSLENQQGLISLKIIAKE